MKEKLKIGDKIELSLSYRSPRAENTFTGWTIPCPALKDSQKVICHCANLNSDWDKILPYMRIDMTDIEQIGKRFCVIIKEIYSESEWLVAIECD